MKFKTLLILVILFLGVSGTLMAQTDANHDVTLNVTGFAMIAVTGNLSLEINTATAPGDVPEDDSDNSGRLSYTVIAGGVSKKITAELGAGDAVPAGTELTVTANPVGSARRGTSAGEKTLSTSAEDVVNTIWSCATGADGCTLTYNLKVLDVEDLVAGDSETVTVTYTITDTT